MPGSSGVEHTMRERLWFGESGGIHFVPGGPNAKIRHCKWGGEWQDIPNSRLWTDEVAHQIAIVLAEDMEELE